MKPKSTFRPLQCKAARNNPEASPLFTPLTPAASVMEQKSNEANSKNKPAFANRDRHSKEENKRTRRKARKTARDWISPCSV